MTEAGAGAPGWRPGGGIVDFHNHVISGVDDGAQDEAETRSALALLAAEGVTALIATPHVELSVATPEAVQARLRDIDAGWAALVRIAADSGMRVHRGAELRLDVPDPDLSDERLRLAGGRFVLVEFPYFIVPPRSARVLGWLLDQGWQPVLAHPERYSGVDGDLAAVAEWREAGAYLQVNGGSLLGRYGVAARRLAVGMLARGWVDYVCSDYHARGAPRVTSYGAWLERHGGPETAMRLLSDNPARLLSGELPLPVAPLAPDAGVEADEP